MKRFVTYVSVLSDVISYDFVFPLIPFFFDFYTSNKFGISMIYFLLSFGMVIGSYIMRRIGTIFSESISLSTGSVLNIIGNGASIAVNQNPYVYGFTRFFSKLSSLKETGTLILIPLIHDDTTLLTRKIIISLRHTGSICAFVLVYTISMFYDDIVTTWKVCHMVVTVLCILTSALIFYGYGMENINDVIHCNFNHIERLELKKLLAVDQWNCFFYSYLINICYGILRNYRNSIIPFTFVYTYGYSLRDISITMGICHAIAFAVSSFFFVIQPTKKWHQTAYLFTLWSFIIHAFHLGENGAITSEWFFKISYILFMTIEFYTVPWAQRNTMLIFNRVRTRECNEINHRIEKNMLLSCTFSMQYIGQLIGSVATLNLYLYVPKYLYIFLSAVVTILVLISTKQYHNQILKSKTLIDHEEWRGEQQQQQQQTEEETV